MVQISGTEIHLYQFAVLRQNLSLTWLNTSSICQNEFQNKTKTLKTNIYNKKI